MSMSKRRILVALMAALVLLLTASAIGGLYVHRGSTDPTRSAGWTWDDSDFV